MFVIAISITVAYAQYTPNDSAFVGQFKGMYYEQVLNKVWNEVKDLNKIKYPNPNLVQPGDTLYMPLGQIHVVKDIRNHDGRHDCMWDAAELFMWNTIFPIQNGTYHAPQSTAPKSDTAKVTAPAATKDDAQLFLDMLPWLAVISVCIVLSILLLGRRKSTPEPEEPSNAFCDNPPDFETASDEEIHDAVQASVNRALGRNFEVLEVVPGLITGLQTVTFSNGTTRDEEFNNVQGYRARVRDKKTGRERDLYGQQICMNPLGTSVASEFSGTFTPDDDTLPPSRIPFLENEQVDVINRHQTEGTEVTIDDLPGEDIEPAAETVITSTLTPTADGRLHITKLQVSPERGMTIEGSEIAITIEDLHSLLYQVTGKHPNDLKKE